MATGAGRNTAPTILTVVGGMVDIDICDIADDTIAAGVKRSVRDGVGHLAGKWLVRLVASGDFVGRGIWTLVQDGSDVLVTYDWKILAEKPLLRNLSFIMKPIFGANHYWAMAKGEESLKLELAWRRAR